MSSNPSDGDPGAEDRAPRAGHVFLEAFTAPGGDRPRYTITRLHAEGGLGRIWMARDAALNREVALKELKESQAASADARERFLQEAQVTGQLEHPNIVPVYELGRQPGQDQPYYTMRFVRGETLRAACHEYHRRRRSNKADKLEMPRLLNAFVAVCQAVSYAHSRGVVHRDLKPDNVVLGAYGEVLVLDWGLAKVAGSEESTAPAVEVTADASPCQTRAGSVIGTPAYMAPEQAAGDHDKVGPQTDIYGLGAILFEILTGEPPRGGSNVSELIERIRRGPSPRVRHRSPSVSRALDAICGRAMEHAPEDRYASASALAEDVQRYLADEPVTAFAEPVSARVGRFFRKHRTWALAAAIMLLVITGVAIASSILINQQREIAERQRGLAVAAHAAAQKALKVAEERRLAALAAQRETQAALEREAIQLQRATANVLAGQSTLACGPSPQEALLVAVEASQATRRHGQLETPAARQALYDALSMTGGVVLHAPPHTMSIEEAPSAPPRPPTAEPTDPDSAPPAPPPEAATNELPVIREVTARTDLTHVAISPSGRWVAAVNGALVSDNIFDQQQDSQNPAIYLWDLHARDTDASLQIVRASDATALAVTFDPLERWMIVESADNLLYGWSTGRLSGQPDFSLACPGTEPGTEGSPPMLMGSAVSDNGQSLAAVWTDGTVALWALADAGPKGPPRVLRQRPSSGTEVAWILWSADGRSLVTAWSAELTESAFGASLRPGLAQAILGPLASLAEPPPTEICHWNLEALDRNEKPHVVRIPDQILKSVALSPDGERLAAGTVHGKILVWKAGPEGPEGEPVELMQGTKGIFSGGTDDLKFFPDGEWLLSGSTRSSRLWWMPQVDKLGGDAHPFAVFGPGSQVLVSPDGIWFATVGLDQAGMTLHDFIVLTADAEAEAGILEIDENAYELERMYRDKPYVRLVNQDPDDGSAVSAIMPLSGHQRGVYAWHTDGKGERIVSAGGDATVRVWDVRRYSPQALPRRVMKEGNAAELVVGMAEGGSRLLTVRTTETDRDQPPQSEFFLVNPLEPDGRRTPVNLRAADEIDQVAMSRDGRLLAAFVRPSEPAFDNPGGTNLRVHLWQPDIAADPRVLTVALPDGFVPPSAWNCGLSPDERWLTLRSQDRGTGDVSAGGHLYVWDLKAEDVAASLQNVSVSGVPLAEPAWAPDGATLAVAGGDGSLRVFDMRSDKPWQSPWVRSTPSIALTAASFSADGDVLAIGQLDGKVELLRRAAERWLTARPPLAGATSGIVSLAFSSSGQWLAAAHQVDAPRLWNLSTDAEAVLPLPVDRNSFVVVKFSPDERWLLTAGSYRQPCVLWDLKSPRVEQAGVRLYRRWELLDGRGDQLQFSADSRCLVCGNLLDCATWPLDIDELEGMAKRVAGRDLTDEERQRYQLPALEK